MERAISTLRLTPVMFELGARPYPPQQLYRAYLAQSDVFVGLYWQRYGQLSPGMQISGLRRSSSWPGRCRGSYTSRRRRPTANRTWPNCWPV